MVKTFLGKSKCNEPFRFQAKLCAMAPLCNILMVSLTFPFFAVKSCALIFFPMRTSRAGGRVWCLCLNRAAKSKDLSSDTWVRPTSVISAKSSGLRVSLPSHATSPKDLGTYSPREIHMRKPMSGCARHSAYAPTLGLSSNMHRKDETCNTAGVAPQPARDASQQAQQPPQDRSQ